MATKCHARSISLPSRSHPSTSKVEEELKKMKTFESSSSSSSVYDALLGVQGLYDSIDELLKMGSTQKVLSSDSNPQHKPLVEELLDGSMKLLEVCSLAKDMVLENQQHVGALRSIVRRSKEDSAIKIAIANYTCYRKKMKKEAKKLIMSMKKMNEKSNSSPMENTDHHLSSVTGVLRQAFSTNSSIFESVLLCLAPLTRPNARGWSLVSKWVHKGAISCESNSGLNEVDVALNSMEVEKLQIAPRKLESLEMAAQEMESGLDGVFRRLIKTRASLLNIISQ